MYGLHPAVSMLPLAKPIEGPLATIISALPISRRNVARLNGLQVDLLTSLDELLVRLAAAEKVLDLNFI
jgi:hypothetical protein